MKHLTIHLSAESHAALKALAARRRLGIEAAATAAVEAWIDRGGSNEAEQCRALLSSVEDGQRAICGFIADSLTAGG